MVRCGEYICPDCGAQLKYYDKVLRVMRTKRRHTTHIQIERYRCIKCNHTHRALPDFIFPYKQYESEIIIGVIDNLITCETFGFEDYPCEMTMLRWKTAQNLQGIL